MSSLARVWKRDWQVQAQNFTYTLTPFIFYLTVVSIFAVSDKINAGVVWAAALLAVVVSMQSMFRDDYDSGVFSYLLLEPLPLPVVILSKVICHWVTTQLPVIIVTPLIMADASMVEIGTITVSLCIGSIALSLLGAVVAALTIALPQGGLLLSILSIPLYMPILMLGLSSSYAAANSLPVAGYICLLLACVLLALSFAPLLVSLVIKVNMQ